MVMFDIVIPCHPKDYEMLNACISSVNAHIKGFRKIYIISIHPMDGPVSWVPEDKFPFSRADVYNRLNTPSKDDLVHWHLQQLLKMHAWDVCPDILDDIVIFDADTVMLRDIEFMVDGVPQLVYTASSEQETKYFQHMARLHPSFTPVEGKSGTIDYQIWNKNVFAEIKSKVEELHEKPFWCAYIDCCQEAQNPSEQELYFHYYVNSGRPCNLITKKQIRTPEFSKYGTFASEGYDSMGCHAWMGPRR
jgi:Family of unknown function (DUF6492)